MADAADTANDVQEFYTAAAVAAVPTYEGVSALTCEECGDEIPKRRREAVPGCSVCVPCQSWREVLAERAKE